MGKYCLKTFFFQNFYSRGLFICVFDTTQLSLTDAHPSKKIKNKKLTDAHFIRITKPATLRCTDLLTDILICLLICLTKKTNFLKAYIMSLES